MKSGDPCKCGSGRMLTYATKPTPSGTARVRYLRCTAGCGQTGTQRIPMTAERAARERKLTNLVKTSPATRVSDLGPGASAGKILYVPTNHYATAGEHAMMLDIKHLANRLATTVSGVRDLLELGSIPRPVFVGPLARWRETDVQEWVAAGCPQAASPDDEFLERVSVALHAEYCQST